MAKQLLGKEVTAALNEKIKANVAELQAKGVDPTLCIIRVGENPSDISYEREVLQSAVRLLVLHVRKSFFRRMFPRMSFLQPSIK